MIRNGQEALSWLHEHGSVHFVAMSHEEPDRGREERSGLHVASGCRVSIVGWREGPDEPLQTDSTLRWQPPLEKPQVSLKDAMAELLDALRDGRVLAKAEPLTAPGVTVDVPTSAWLHAELRLPVSRRSAGTWGRRAILGGKGARRLRFRADRDQRRCGRELTGGARGAIRRRCGQVVPRFCD